METAARDALTFDFFPGMLFQRPPRFTCEDIENEPALLWTGMIAPALKHVLKRFPETQALGRGYEWTLRASYALLTLGLAVLSGPLLSILGSRVLEDVHASEEVRLGMFISGLALVGVSLLLNKDSGGQLKNLVAAYNARSLAEKRVPEKHA